MGRGRQPGPARAHAGLDRARGAGHAPSEPPRDEWIRGGRRPRCARCGLPGRWSRAAPTMDPTRTARTSSSLSVLIERRALWGTPVIRYRSPRAPSGTRGGGAGAPRAGDSPPTGFDADSVLELDGRRSDMLDIRRAAVIPIVELGPLGGGGGRGRGGLDPRAAAGRGRTGRARATARRRRSPTRSSSRSSCGSSTTCDQLAPAAARRSLDPAAISPLTRDYLRDVFRAVTTVQRRACAVRAADAARPRPAATQFAAAGRPDPETPWREAALVRDRPRADRARPRSDEIIAIGAMPIEQGRLILGESRYTLARTARRRAQRGADAQAARRRPRQAPPLERADRPAARDAQPAASRCSTPRRGTDLPEPLFSPRGCGCQPRADTEASGRLLLRSATAPRRPGCRSPGCSKRARSAGRGAPPRARRRALHRQAFIALASRLDAGSRRPSARCYDADSWLASGRRFGAASSVPSHVTRDIPIRTTDR